jgi:hypothetical protein
MPRQSANDVRASHKQSAALPQSRQTFEIKILTTTTGEVPMPAFFKNYGETLSAVVAGAVLAVIASAVLLLAYRFFVGRNRPYFRDAAGTTVAAITGSLVIAVTTLTGDIYSNATKQPIGTGIRALAIAMAVVLMAVGLKLARNSAGYHTVRSAASDIIPLGVAALIGLFFALLLSALAEIN